MLDFLLSRFRTEEYDGSRVVRLSARVIDGYSLDAVIAPRPSESLCPRCGNAMPPALLVSRLPSEDLDRAANAPQFVVDGWHCATCKTHAFPRPVSVALARRYHEEAMRHARAARWPEAEWWFSRILWAWPSYPAVHNNLATVLIRWASGGTDAFAERMRRRARALLDRGRAMYERDARGTEPQTAAELLLTLAEVCEQQEDWDAAQTALDACRRLQGGPHEAERSERLERRLRAEPWIFRAAYRRAEPYFQLQDRPHLPLTDEAERAAVGSAADTLLAHYSRHQLWASIYGAAMARTALGDDDALRLWRQAAAAHPAQPDILRETSIALHRHGLNEEARALNRLGTDALPTDLTIWCNRGLSELLCGDVDTAQQCVDRALALEPKDQSSLNLRRIIEKCRLTGWRPKSKAELQLP